MQLNPADRPKSIRSRLNAAACVLLASGMPGVARAADQTPKTTLDLTGLWYNERITVIEPTARITRIEPSGQSFWGQIAIDAISGASPTGGLPTGQTQTVTGPSGSVTTRSASEVPLNNFRDTRVGLDGEWLKPFGPFKSTLGAHFSREKDYQSLGATGKLSFDFNQRLTTVTLGAGYNKDAVFPVGGTRAGLSDPSVIVGTDTNPKRVTTGLLGVSRVLTRKWMVGLSGSVTSERGYLTDPYKLLSLVDPSSGLPLAEISEKRPSTRERVALLANSVYHLTDDVIYVSYRYYRDDWDLRSHTIDFKYRYDLGRGLYVEPHVRYYIQTGASFFRSGLIVGEPLPDFASSDYRLGPLRTTTLGITFGFPFKDYPGEWTVRTEYLGRFGDSHPVDAVGVQRGFDLAPSVNTTSVVIGYSYNF